MNVTGNRKFVLTHYPPAIQNLINNNQMPEYIEEVIFSGSSNITEIKRLIFNDDDVMKAMLPKKVADMLEVNSVEKNSLLELLLGLIPISKSLFLFY